MKSLKKSRSLPVISSSSTRTCCAIPASGRLLPEQKSRRVCKEEDDEFSDSPSFQTLHSRATSVSSEKEAGSSFYLDIRHEDNDCGAGSLSSDEVRRGIGVIASEDPGRETVKASPESSLDQREVHKRRQQQLFSLLAASAAATVTRPDIRSAVHSEPRPRTMFPSHSAADDGVRHGIRMSEPSTPSSSGEASDEMSERIYFSDELILRELSEMRQILQKLLEQNKELSLIASPLIGDDDILSAVLGLRSSTAAGQSRP